MMDLRDLYQDIILDHSRHPRNSRAIEAPSHFAHGHNPLCGDKVTIFLKLEGNRIVDASFAGRGCAISTASASLMTEILTGKTIGEAEALFRSFTAKVTGAAEPELPESLEEDAERLEPLTGVKTFPVRVKCATLPWRAFEAALKSGAVGATVKTE
jgi:nitrogen fixation NifU-like protein